MSVLHENSFLSRCGESFCFCFESESTAPVSRFLALFTKHCKCSFRIMSEERPTISRRRRASGRLSRLSIPNANDETDAPPPLEEVKEESRELFQHFVASEIAIHGLTPPHDLGVPLTPGIRYIYVVLHVVSLHVKEGRRQCCSPARLNNPVSALLLVDRCVMSPVYFLPLIRGTPTWKRWVGVPTGVPKGLMLSLPAARGLTCTNIIT